MKGVRIGPWRIKADRWPWQGWGWFPHRAKGKSPGFAPLNSSGARFGGGWAWKVGISVGPSGRSIIIDLLFGSVRIDRMERGK